MLDYYCMANGMSGQCMAAGSSCLPLPESLPIPTSAPLSSWLLLQPGKAPGGHRTPTQPCWVPPSRDAASPGGTEGLRAGEEPEWFGGRRQGEHSCWCSLPAEHQVGSILHIQGGWLWRTQGWAMPSTFLQNGITLPVRAQCIPQGVQSCWDPCRGARRPWHRAQNTCGFDDDQITNLM